jgi:hypothetical protein
MSYADGVVESQSHTAGRFLLIVGKALALAGCGLLQLAGYPAQTPLPTIAVAPADSLTLDFRLDFAPLDGTAAPPPSGAYTCVYTDERNQQTTLRVRSPAGDLRILSPTSGATLQIPGPLPSRPDAN